VGNDRGENQPTHPRVVLNPGPGRRRSRRGGERQPCQTNIFTTVDLQVWREMREPGAEEASARPAWWWERVTSAGAPRFFFACLEEMSGNQRLSYGRGVTRERDACRYCSRSREEERRQARSGEACLPASRRPRGEVFRHARVCGGTLLPACARWFLLFSPRPPTNNLPSRTLKSRQYRDQRSR